MDSFFFQVIMQQDTSNIHQNNSQFVFSNCIKINSKNNLINKYYSILIHNIQKQKTRLITINHSNHY